MLLMLSLYVLITRWLPGVHAPRIFKVQCFRFNVSTRRTLSIVQAAGHQNFWMRLVFKASPPNVFIGGPVPNAPGFPLQPEADPSEAQWRKKHAGMTDFGTQFT